MEITLELVKAVVGGLVTAIIFMAGGGVYVYKKSEKQNDDLRKENSDMQVAYKDTYSLYYKFKSESEEYQRELKSAKTMNGRLKAEIIRLQERLKDK